jgi:methionyl-tRNA formyltransferase
VDEESSEVMHEDESMEEEELETENPTWDIVEELTWEVSEIDSWEVEELTWFVEELTWTIVENTGTEEETVIEEIKYNEEPIIWERTYNNVTVRVEALSWIFPEWTELKIEPIKSWNLSSLKDKLVEEKEEIKDDTTIVAFDITIRYEWEEVQPKDWEKVKETSDYSRNEEL